MDSNIAVRSFLHFQVRGCLGNVVTLLRTTSPLPQALLSTLTPVPSPTPDANVGSVSLLVDAAAGVSGGCWTERGVSGGCWESAPGVRGSVSRGAVLARLELQSDSGSQPLKGAAATRLACHDDLIAVPPRLLSAFSTTTAPPHPGQHTCGALQVHMCTTSRVLHEGPFTHSRTNSEAREPTYTAQLQLHHSPLAVQPAASQQQAASPPASHVHTV